jgi:hypothetical protein
VTTIQCGSETSYGEALTRDTLLDWLRIKHSRLPFADVNAEKLRIHRANARSRPVWLPGVFPYSVSPLSIKRAMTRPGAAAYSRVWRAHFGGWATGRLMPHLPARASLKPPWRVCSLHRPLCQIGNHPREDGLPRGLPNLHSSHEDYRPDEYFQAISRKCVAFSIALRLDPRLSRVKPRLFGSCPRHFTQARPSLARACVLSGPPSRRATI